MNNLQDITQDRLVRPIHPGEVIASGTVPTGCGLELGRFLKPNDVVELEIERIGVLRNKIVRLQQGEQA